jgi:hypothetical protein
MTLSFLEKLFRVVNLAVYHADSRGLGYCPTYEGTAGKRKRGLF